MQFFVSSFKARKCEFMIDAVAVACLLLAARNPSAMESSYA